MRNFKRSIILALTLVLCIGAVVSGTIAWFTDVTETRGSTVKASVLKAGLYKDQITAANRVSETSPAIFTVPERWEPGAVSYANLFIKNEGNVALWYELSLRVDDFNTIVGTDYSLLDVLKVAVVPKEIPANATRAEVFSWAEASPSCSLDQLLTTGILYPANDTNTSNSQTVHPRSLVLYWPSTYGNDVDNRYNLNKGQEVNKPLVNDDGTKTNELYADVSVVLVATQAPVEFDSFNNGDYDAGAQDGRFYPVSSESALNSKLENGENVQLTSDITINTPAYVDEHCTIGIMLANNTLDAQDHNIKFNVDPDDMSAYGIYVNGAATINDLSSFTAADNTPLFDVIHIGESTGNVLINRSNLTGVKVISHDGFPGVPSSLTVNQCTLNGSVAYYGPSFYNDCTFGPYMGGLQPGNLIQTSAPLYAANAVFTDCTFTPGIVIKAWGTLTFKNCKFGNTPITADNYSDLNFPLTKANDSIDIFFQ